MVSPWSSMRKRSSRYLLVGVCIVVLGLQVRQSIDIVVAPKFKADGPSHMSNDTIEYTNTSLPVSDNLTTLTLQQELLSSNGPAKQEWINPSQPASIEKDSVPSPKPLNQRAFAQNYSLSLLQSTEPWSNCTTLGFWRRRFIAGFRNQVMSFTAFAMWAKYHGHEQILLATLNHKDTYGSNRYMPFDYLFDVEHWNQQYPTVPRLVRCVNFSDLDCQYGKWITTNMESCRSPFALGEPTKLFANYQRYSKGNGPLAEGYETKRNPIDVAVLRGALRPHPNIRHVMDQVLHTITNGSDYWTLHARVEPDMQIHPMCPDLKLTNLTTLFAMLQRAFPIPPAKLLFLPINRPTLEEGAQIQQNQKKTNWLAIDNLRALNHAVANGLWNGTVKVFELGSNVLNGTQYARTPSTIGAMMNFEWAIAASSKVFVGTPVSTWSVDVVGSRFYRGYKDSNFQYLPEGIIPWTTTLNMTEPPRFKC